MSNHCSFLVIRFFNQSYNCGRDDSVFEATARTAGMSANKGIVYYSASGAWSPSSVSSVLYCVLCSVCSVVLTRACVLLWDICCMWCMCVVSEDIVHYTSSSTWQLVVKVGYSGVYHFLNMVLPFSC